MSPKHWLVSVYLCIIRELWKFGSASTNTEPLELFASVRLSPPRAHDVLPDSNYSSGTYLNQIFIETHLTLPCDENVEFFYC
jgi:hypothetical protein